MYVQGAEEHFWVTLSQLAFANNETQRTAFS